jgi:hypothetical protein
MKLSPGGKSVVILFSFPPFFHHLHLNFLSHPQIHHFIFSFSTAYLFLFTFAFDKIKKSKINKRYLKKEKGKQLFTFPLPLFKLSQVIQVVIISMLNKGRFACWFLCS